MKTLKIRALPLLVAGALLTAGASFWALQMPAGASSRLLYVYLTQDNGIFIMHGDHGKETWVTPHQLQKELAALKQRNGMVLYSRENPEQDPTPPQEQVLDLILGYRLPIRILTDQGSTYRPVENS